MILRPFVYASLALAAALASPTVQAQSKPALPKAEDVLEQYVEATGGRAAYEKLKNRVAVGTIAVTGANLEGKVTLTQAAPNKQLLITDIGAAGKTTQGIDGENVWEISTINGERVLEGEEKDTTLGQSEFNSELNYRKRYKSMECQGIEDVDGKPAYKLLLTRKVGPSSTEFYDVASHLIVKQVSTVKSPMGEIKVEVYPGEYKKVDGILMPFSVKQKVFGQELVMTFKEIKHNVDLPKETFDLPKEIGEILKKKKAK